MAKTNYNKNVSKPSDVTASVFSSEENLRYGEIVLCNSIDEPGLYIYTKDGEGVTKIQKVNSIENIILKENIDSGATGAVASGDTLYEIVSKLQNEIDDIAGSGGTSGEKVNKIIVAVGLNPDGSYSAITGNYVASATNIADAIAKLDAAIDSVSGSTLSDAKDYADQKIENAVKALDAEVTAISGEVFTKIIEVDGVVSGEVKTLSVSRDITGLQYDLKLGDYTFGSIDIPQDQFLSSVTFISAATVQDVAEALTYGITIEIGKPYLKFIWKLGTDVISPTYVDISGLVNVYTAKDVDLSDSYTGTSFDIKSGTSLEDAVGKITNELTNIEESVHTANISSPEKTINIVSSNTGTNVDVNIDNDTIVKSNSLVDQGKLSVKLEVEKTNIDSGYVRTQYVLKSSGSTYGTINDTREIISGGSTPYLTVTTEQVTDSQGNRTDKVTINPVIQEVINNAEGISIADGNGLTTAWAVKNYMRTGSMDGDSIYVGDDDLTRIHPIEHWRGKINFDSSSMDYDTVHQALFKTDNNMQFLDEALGFPSSGESVHHYPTARTQSALIIDTASNVMDALMALDTAIDDLDYSANTEENKVITGITQENGRVSVTSEFLTARKLAGYVVETVVNPSGETTKVAATDTLGEGLGKLQGQINSMDWTGATTSNEIFTGITEKDGLVSASTALATSRTLSGYTVETVVNPSESATKVAATDTLGTALGKLQGQINSMDWTGSTTDSEVFTGITENDGLVSASTKLLTNVKLSGYTEGAVTSGKILETDTLGEALGKLQGQVNGLDWSGSTTDNEIFNEIIEDDGLISASTRLLTSVKLSGYTVGPDASGKLDETDTLGQALGKLQGQVNGLDWTGSTTANEVFTGITEADGKVSATTELLTNVKLSGYTVGSDSSGKIAETDTLGEALGKLQGQINGMDYSANTDSDKVFTYISEVDGVISTSSDLITNRVINGYDTTANTKVSATDTIGEAFGNLQGQIDSMDWTGATTENEVFTGITEADGVVSASTKLLTSVKLSGYTEGATTSGKILETDTLGVALGKLQGQVSGLDWTGTTTENEVFTGITEDDGLISASTKLLTSVKLSGYTVGSDSSGKLDETDTLGEALGKLQGQINGLDWTGATTENEVFTGITEADGKVSASTTNITNVKLAGYAVQTAEKVATGDTLGQGLGKLQGQIDAMDYTATTTTDQVFTKYEEADGKPAITAGNVTDRTIGGYAVQESAKVAATDKLGVALGKLQGQIDAMVATTVAEENSIVSDVTETDGKLSATTKHVVDVKLSGYTLGSNTAITSAMTLGEALGDLQAEINATNSALDNLDTTTVSEENSLVSDIIQTNGKISASTKHIVDVKLSGYTEGSDADITSAMTLGQALGNLQKQINSMVATTVAEENSLVSDVIETDGKLAATTKHIVDVKISGYSEQASSKVATGDTLGEALGKLQGQINAMDATSVAEANSIVSDVTETDGKLAATTKYIVDVKLSGYTEGATTSGKILETDTLGEALGKLQGQINGLDWTGSTTTDEVFTNITEADGKSSATTANITTRTLGGYAVQESDKVAATDTLGDALGKLQGQINGLDWTGSTTTDEVFTNITEADGKVSAATELITSRTLSGYSTTADTKVAATDTLGDALGKLQGQINSMDKTASTETGKFVRTVSEADGKVSETLGYILDSDVKIASATPSTINVKEEWKIVNQAGTQLGDSIKIYKDQTLKSVALSGDSSTTGQWLVFTYILSDGSESVVSVDVSKFLVQAEFKSGVTADNSGIVHGVVDSNSESFLTVGANGFKLSGVTHAINSAIEGLDSSSVTTNNTYAITSVTMTNGKIESIGQTNKIASASTSNYAVDAGTVAGKTVGNDDGNVPLSNGTVNTNLNADTVDGYHIVVGSTGTTANTIYIL